MAEFNNNSRIHDLTAACLGGAALIFLCSLPWQIDTSGPEPFFKGPLIYPLLVLSIMFISSWPAFLRLLKNKDRVWFLDGQGLPNNSVVVLLLLIGFFAGFILIGIEFSVWLFLTCGLYFLRHRKPLLIILLPLLTALCFNVILKRLLQVYFPPPIILEVLGYV